MLDEGRYGSVRELADGEGVKPSYVAGMLRLTLLAPDIVEAILDGRQPDGMSLDGLMAGPPAIWERQDHVRPARPTPGVENSPGCHSSPASFLRPPLVPEELGSSATLG